MWRVEDENGLNGEVGPSEFYASRHNKDSLRQNPVTKSSEPSVTQLKTGKSWSRLTGNPHQRTSDIRIGTEPKWANIVWRGIQTVHGQEWLDVWPSEVQKALHVVRHGTVVFLEDVWIPVPLHKAIDVWRVRREKRSLVVGCHGGRSES